MIYIDWKKNQNFSLSWQFKMSILLNVACIQTCSSTNIEENIEVSVSMVREAAKKGAQLVALPEVVNICQRRGTLAKKAAQIESKDPALLAYRELSKELGIWILVGSLAIRREGGDRLANRSYLLNNLGEIVARYDKIHMFDVALANGYSFKESENYRPGAEAVLANSPWGPIGLTICYDLRFPYLYRCLAKAGAKILTVPSAFTRKTGSAHWHVLLRSRAIETGSYILAPAQCGDHEDGRKSFGHSLIINPWGEVLADGGPEVGTVNATLDLDKVTEARTMIPALDHERPISKSFS